MKERRKKTGGAEALFTAVGTVIGAGFVSGRELLQFFGCFRLPDLCFAGALFFGGFFLFLKLGGKFGGFEGALAGVFGKFAPAVKGILLFGSFVSCAGMLSAADALLPKAAPFLSLVFLALSCAVSERGISGIGKVSLFFVPVLLLSVFALILSEGALSRPDPSAFSAPSAASVFLYAGMNVFLSMPVLCELGARCEGRAAPLSAGAALIITAAAGLVLSAVCSDKNSHPCDLPLAYILNGEKLFFPLAGGGMLLSLMSAFYPLYVPAGKKWGGAGKAALAAAVLLCSLIPFGKIVARVYPALGAAGGAACLFSAFSFALSSAGKKRRKSGRKKVNFCVKEKKDFY